MPVKIKEWTQREWRESGINLYREKGDFNNLTALLPGPTAQLKRDPAWSSHVDIPDEMFDIRGMVWDTANFNLAVIGRETDGATKVVSTLFDGAWAPDGATHDLIVATTDVGGTHPQNIAHYNGKLYVIGKDKKVYRGASVSAALAEFYAPTDAKLLAPVGDRMYLVTETGQVLRLNDADTAFENHYTPITDLNIVYFTAFRGYIALFNHNSGGGMTIYRLADRGTETPTTLHQIAFVPPLADERPWYNGLFTTFDDQIYFALARRTSTPSHIAIYRFNGSQVIYVTEFNDIYPSTQGLTTWRNYLIYYALPDLGAQTIKVLVGNQFVDFTPISTTARAEDYLIFDSLNDQLIFTGWDTTNGEGLHYTDIPALSDGNYESARLDLGHPARPKRLESITVLLDGHATDFKIPVSYRTDDNAGWTLATTGNDTQHVTIGALGVEFYTIQLKIELDDDTGNNEDIKIDAISILYSVNE